MAIFALDGEPPSMERADQVSTLDLAERKRHATMRATVHQRSQSAIGSAKQDDPLPSCAKLHRIITDIASQSHNRPLAKSSNKTSSPNLKMVVRKMSTRASVSAMMIGEKTDPPRGVRSYEALIGLYVSVVDA
jgi:hypothetical protein